MAAAAESEPTTPPSDRAKPPFLRRVRIRNYKSIAFCDVTLEPLTVLVGRNGSGKSNFLDALAFIRDIFATNLTEATRRHGGWGSVLCRAAPTEEISFELEVALETSSPATGHRHYAEYGFTLVPGQNGPPVVLREWLRTRDDEDAQKNLIDLKMSEQKFRNNIAMIFDDNIARNKFDGINDYFFNKPFLVFEAPRYRGLAEGLRITDYYNFHVPLLRQPQQSIPGSLLEGDGRNLAGVIRDAERIDPWHVERVGQFLSVIVPEVERFVSVPVAGYDTLKFYLRQGDGRPPLEFDAASMSDGTLRALAALMAVYQVQQPSGPHVVGIEEPETALHPAAMNALVGALDEATLRTQVLITTHSADLLDHPDIRPENVRVVRMVDGRTVIGRVDEASVEIVKDGLNTLGGLERDDSLGIDLDDLDRQAELSRSGQGPHE